jgi:alcohol dehydrogenase class IV
MLIMNTELKTQFIPDFHIPTELFIRENIISDIGNIVKKYGSRVVVVTTESDFAKFQDILDQIPENMKQADIGCIIYDEMPDSPNTEFIDTAAHFLKKTSCDVIIGFGGIDSINCAKAISILLNNYIFAEELFDYPQINPPVNLITVPAYPIYGFEILPMLFMTNIHDMVKQVYRNNWIYPKATIIDPKISLLIDDSTTTKTAISSLAIATESVVSKKNNGIINTLALRTIDLIFKNLPLAYRDPQNPTPRSQLSIASVMSGIAFSISDLSVSLALSLALSSMTNIDVDAGTGLILPHVMEYNLTSSPGKYVQMSKVMDEDVKDITVIEAAIKAVEGVRKLELDVDLPQRLSQFDITKSDFSKIAQIALSYPFLTNAPRPLTINEIETILIAAY